MTPHRIRLLFVAIAAVFTATGATAAQPQQPVPWITVSPKTSQAIGDTLVKAGATALGNAYGPPYIGGALGNIIGGKIVNYMDAHPVPPPSLKPPPFSAVIPYSYLPPPVPTPLCGLFPSIPSYSTCKK